MRILLVEDDRMLGDGLQAGLTQAGYAVDWLRDGEAAVAALSTESFAAVVLDLGLPKRDGLSVLQWLRGRHDATPVLILTKSPPACAHWCGALMAAPSRCSPSARSNSTRRHAP
jgi:DNA-binding response OmpR family regulator